MLLETTANADCIPTRAMIAADKRTRTRRRIVSSFSRAVTADNATEGPLTERFRTACERRNLHAAWTVIPSRPAAPLGNGCVEVEVWTRPEPSNALATIR